MIEQFIDKLHNDPTVILDLGCGRGMTSFLLRKRFSRPLLLSLDTEESSLRYLVVNGINGDVVCANATMLPLRDTSIDLVVCDQVIEHVEKQHNLISELFRVSKPGSSVIVGSVMRKRFAISAYRGQNGKIALSYDHVREYSSKQEFASLFKDQFDIEEISAVPVWFPLFSTIFAILVKLRICADDPTPIRELSTKHPWINRFKLPRPGFYFIYAVCRRN